MEVVAGSSILALVLLVVSNRLDALNIPSCNRPVVSLVRMGKAPLVVVPPSVLSVALLPLVMVMLNHGYTNVGKGQLW